MNPVVGDVLNRELRPPYVRFEREAVEDVAESRKQGRYVAKDVDFAYVTPPYSKDVFKQKADVWLRQIKQDARDGRIPVEWVAQFEAAYQRWKNGQEIPLNGIPIKGWGVISPAQQQMLISANILTVEDLAALNDEGMRRIGMGAMQLKEKARAWLAQLEDKGKITQEMAALRTENELLKKTVSSLEEKLAELKAMVSAYQRAQEIQAQPAEASQKVSVHAELAQAVAEALDSGSAAVEAAPASRQALVEAYERMFGRKPHHWMKDETIAKAIGVSRPSG